MSAHLRKLALIALLPTFALIYFLAAYFSFYQGGYDAPPTVAIPFESIDRPASSQTIFTETPRIQPGTLLVDGGHRNDFSKGEITSLLASVAARGHDIQFIGESGSFGGFRRLDPSLRLELLEEKLRQADSLAVILPNEPYEPEEADLVERFVDQGGRLLLIADPTRRHQINSLAARFGITFQPDYLYNTVDYDLNFQNIYISNFLPDEITRGLGRIALYTTGSVKSASPGLAYTDGNTRSSLVERIEPFFPMTRVHEGRVLAIADLTFMVPPQDAILDNNQLVANIADFLTANEREFGLTDFPYFFQRDVDIVLGRSTPFEQGTVTKALLSDFGISSKITGTEDITRDTLFLGLYQDASDVAQYLEIAGIRLGAKLVTPFTPPINRDGTSMALLHRGPDRYVLAILGESEQTIADLVERLGSGEFRSGLVGDFVGVYRTP